MTIDFRPDNPKDVTPQKGGIDFVPHETVGGHLRDIGKRLLEKIDTVSNAKPATQAQKSAIQIANTLWQTAPYIVGGEAAALGKAPGFIMKAAEGMPKVAKYLTELGGVAGKNALFGASAATAESALNDDMKNVGSNALSGAAVGGALGAAAKPVLEAVNALRPSNWAKLFKGGATPDEIKARAEMLGELPVGIGHIVDSNALRGIENFVNKFPFSGGVTRAEKVREASENQSDKLLNLMRGEQTEEDIVKNVREGISANKKMHRTTADKLYGDFLNTAKAEGVRISETPKTQTLAQNLLKEHAENQTPLDAKAVTQLEKLANPEMTGDIVKGQLPKTREVEELHNQIKSLKKTARLTETKDPYLASVYNDLSGAMREDLHGTALASGKPDLTAKLAVADKHYRENYVPYKQKDVNNFLAEKSNSENAGNFLTQSKSHIDKIVSELPDNLKKSTAYLKFKSAIKEQADKKYGSEPSKLFNAYNKLSDSQKNKLFSRTEQKEWRKLGVLSEAAKYKGKASTFLGMAEGMLPIYELLLHGNLEGALGGAALAGGVGLGARAAGNALSSPALRNTIANAPIAAPMMNTNALMGLAGGLGAQSAPQQPINIDFQSQSPNNVNALDADVINNQMLETDFQGNY